MLAKPIKKSIASFSILIVLVLQKKHLTKAFDNSLLSRITFTLESEFNVFRFVIYLF